MRTSTTRVTLPSDMFFTKSYPYLPDLVRAWIFPTVDLEAAAGNMFELMTMLPALKSVIIRDILEITHGTSFWLHYMEDMECDSETEPVGLRWYGPSF